MSMRLLLISCLLLVFQQITVAQDFNILDFGAIPDGKTMNTSHIQAAIDTAHLQGGGRVIIPKGSFLSGSIFLKSGVELYLSKDAVLLGSLNADHYSKVGFWKALVLADGQNNISLTGPGKIDGNGRELSLRLDSLFYAGQLDSADYNFDQLRPKYYLRPMLVNIWESQNIKVKQVTFTRAAGWVQNYERSEYLIIDSIRVESDTYWNNDGIDIVDCRNVILTNSSFNSADDGICLKSHSREYVCESVFINNCTVRSSASAVKFGTKSLGGFKDVSIKNIKVFDTFRSAIAIESVDGGVLENILIDSLEAKNTGNAIFIKLGHRVKGEVGSLKNISIKNVKVEVPLTRPDYAYEVRGPALPFFHNTFPASITGMPGHPVEYVTLENVEIVYPGRGNKGLAYMPISRLDQIPEKADAYPEFSMFGELPAWGFYVRHVQGISFDQVKLRIQAADYRPPLIFDDVHDLQIRDLEITGEDKENKIILHKTSETEIDEEKWILQIN